MPISGCVMPVLPMTVGFHYAHFGLTNALTAKLTMVLV